MKTRLVEPSDRHVVESSRYAAARHRTGSPVQRFHHPAIQRLALWLLLACSGITSKAQYSIDWYKIAGGGGTSTGGVYAVSGTIGQHDAGGPMTGGNYSLTGGFWSLLSVVQSPGAPTLKILLTTTNTAVVYWPSPSTGFTLQQNTNLGTTNWIAPSETVNDNGTNKFIILNPPAGNRFYRLMKP